VHQRRERRELVQVWLCVQHIVESRKVVTYHACIDAARIKHAHTDRWDGRGEGEARDREKNRPTNKHARKQIYTQTTRESGHSNIVLTLGPKFAQTENSWVAAIIKRRCVFVMVVVGFEQKESFVLF
jgi:hypothetical protein